MRKRSISERNFVGAFLGGMLGILSCAYLHPAMLAIGCFAGVLIGFWYQEIGQIIKTAWREASSWFWREYNLALGTVKRNGEKILKKADAVGEEMEWAVRWTNKKIAFWLLTRPAAIARWIKKHPANKVYLVRAAAIVLYSALNVFILLIPFVELVWRGTPGDVPWGLSLFALLLVSLIPPLVLYIDRAGTNNPILEMRYFYRDIEKYDKFGGFYFFIREWTHIHKMQFFLFTLGSCAIIYMVLACALFLAAFVVPLTAFIGIAKGIYRLAIRPNHWLCLGMTIAVTMAIAILSYQHFSSHAMIWSAALMSGVLSGIATEFARKLIARFFQAYRPAYALAAKPVYDQLVPGGKFFLKVLDRSGDLWAARIFKPCFKHWYHA